MRASVESPTFVLPPGVTNMHFLVSLGRARSDIFGAYGLGVTMAHSCGSRLFVGYWGYFLLLLLLGLVSVGF